LSVPRRRLLFAFAGACALAVAFYHQAPSGNGTSRLLTVFSLVEEHRFIADDFQWLTWDKAVVDGHFYSDKAPLSSYVVLPFYWLYRQFVRGPFTLACVEAANHIAVAVAAALPFAIFATLLWWRAARVRPGSRAVWLALAAAFSSFVLIYGSSYFGHVLAGTFFLLSYVLAIDLDKRFHIAGLLAGCAVATEYPLLIAVFFLMLRLWRGPDRVRKLSQFLVGAIAPALLFFFHNKAITGHYLDLPYSHVVDTWKPMRTAFGIRLVDPQALVNLLVTPYRGLLFYAPILIVMIPLLYRQKQRFSVWLLAIYVLFNSTYWVWSGGWCTGPRHLTAATMLCLYEGIAACRRGPSQRLYLGLGAAGALINLASAATVPLPPERDGIPFIQAVIPALLRGHSEAHNLLTEWLHVGPHSWFLVLWLGLIAAIGVVFASLTRETTR
jgi:hypothetical protein